MKPLEGIKVVDLTSYLAAPTTGRVLAEWGADVVKVESFGGDPARRQAGVFNMPMADDENLAFDYANFGKKFMTLNLKSETGMDVMMKLLAEADVFLTSNRTKSLVKMGLDYETLHEKFPKLVYAQVTGYGDKGPEKDAAGFDVTCYMARGGVFGTTVNRGDAPLIPTNGLGDFSVSLFLAAGIAAALYGRTATGTGDRVSVPLQHAGLYTLSTGIISAQYGNAYPKNRREVPNPFNNTVTAPLPLLRMPSMTCRYPLQKLSDEYLSFSETLSLCALSVFFAACRHACRQYHAHCGDGCFL